jgi:hypothetical protein
MHKIIIDVLSISFKNSSIIAQGTNCETYKLTNKNYKYKNRLESGKQVVGPKHMTCFLRGPPDATIECLLRKKTPWPEFASELYRPSERCL